MYTWLIGSYVTAYADCEERGALYFTSGEDENRSSALSELYRIINSGSPPNVP